MGIGGMAAAGGAVLVSWVGFLAMGAQDALQWATVIAVVITTVGGAALVLYARIPKEIAKARVDALKVWEEAYGPSLTKQIDTLRAAQVDALKEHSEERTSFNIAESRHEAEMGLLMDQLRLANEQLHLVNDRLKIVMQENQILRDRIEHNTQAIHQLKCEVVK